jgi:CBS domain-containing protein
MKTVGEIVGQREVYAIASDLTVKEAVDYLYERNIGAVVVCNSEEIVGVFSERDLLRRVVHECLNPADVKVSEVMSKDIFFVTANESHSVARALMLSKKFRHLVVLGEGNRLRGFVSMRELFEVDLVESKEFISSLDDDYEDHQLRPRENECY